MSKFKEIDVNDTTKKNYRFYLDKYYDFVNAPSKNNIQPLLNIKSIENFLSPYKDSSKKSILGIFVSILKKYNNIRALKIVKKLEHMMDELSKNQTGGNKVYTEQIVFNNIDNPLSRFLLSLYTLQPPRRSIDYYKMKIVKNKNNTNENFNYLVEDDKKFLFKVYNTSKKYGDVEIPINDELWNEYLRYKPSRTGNNDMLIQMENGEPVNNNQFISYHLNKILGKGKSVNYLRHHYVVNNLNNEHKKIEDVASQMGHTPSMNNHYFNS